MWGSPPLDNAGRNPVTRKFTRREKPSRAGAYDQDGWCSVKHVRFSLIAESL